MPKHEFGSSEGLYIYDTETDTAILVNHPVRTEVTDEKRLALLRQASTDRNFKGGNHYCEAVKQWRLTDSCGTCGWKLSK